MSVESNVGRSVFDVFESVKAQLGNTVVEKTAGWDIEKSDLKLLINEINAVLDINANRATDVILNHVRELNVKETKGKRKSQ